MRHQALLLVIWCIAISLVFLGCDVQEGSLTVENRSNVTVVSIYISDTEDDSWGQDQLVFDVLRPGRVITFTVEAGTYEVKVVSEYRQEFVYEATIFDGLATVITVR